MREPRLDDLPNPVPWAMEQDGIGMGCYGLLVSLAKRASPTDYSVRGSYAEIASKLGTQKNQISRGVGKLEEQGLILVRDAKQYCDEIGVPDHTDHEPAWLLWLCHPSAPHMTGEAIRYRRQHSSQLRRGRIMPPGPNEDIGAAPYRRVSGRPHLHAVR